MFTKLKDGPSFLADEEAQERKGGGHRSVSLSVLTLIDKITYIFHQFIIRMFLGYNRSWQLTVQLLYVKMINRRKVNTSMGLALELS